MAKSAEISTRWKVVWTAALGCLLCLALSASASASSGDGHFSAGFSVAGSNGYRISVDGWRGAVRVLVTQGPVRIGRHVIEAEYTGPGTASPGGISADLGSLGSISMQFQPSGKRETKTSPKGCQPHKVFRRLGTFVGSFRFVGEDDYTTVEASEVKGSVGTPDDLICSRGFRIGPHPPPPPPFLAARTSNHYLENGFLGFSAIAGAHRRQVYFEAESKEQIGSFSVRRYVAKSGPASSFEVGPNLRSASVAPPPPFSGTATFARQRKGVPPLWSGSLNISFPGKPEVPLTGPSFALVELGQSRFP